MINVEINHLIKGTIIDSMTVIDKKLNEFYQRKQEEGVEIGTNVIKAVSEAVISATASCYEKVNIFKGIHINMFKQEFAAKRDTKLLINIFNGGKVAGSAVKFAKFYLIIDGSEVSGEVDIGESFVKFVHNVKKAIQATKAGVRLF